MVDDIQETQKEGLVNWITMIAMLVAVFIFCLYIAQSVYEKGVARGMQLVMEYLGKGVNIEEYYAPGGSVFVPPKNFTMPDKKPKKRKGK